MRPEGPLIDRRGAIGPTLGAAPTCAPALAAANDVRLAWPPSGAPILIAAHLTGGKAPEPQRIEALAELGRPVATRFA